MDKEFKNLKLSQQLLEIRYKPNSKVLDHRGSWAELISTEMGLSEWIILENRFDVHDLNSKERVFVSFKNAGFDRYDAPTSNYFPDKALKFLKLLFSFQNFGSTIFTERIGVRYKVITPYNKSFDDLLEKYSTRFLTLTDKAKQIFSAKLKDIGGPLNFIDNIGNFNTSSGPMAKEQMRDFIKRKGDYPDVGLYFDIDYWIKPNKDLIGTELIHIVKSFATACWNRHELFYNIICED